MQARRHVPPLLLACGMLAGCGAAAEDATGPEVATTARGRSPTTISRCTAAAATAHPATSWRLAYGSGDVWHPVAPYGKPIDTAEDRGDAGDGY
jgi:hypothetical protein